VRTIRDVVPDIAIRTTCIVGFPGETDEDFQQLMAFLEEISSSASGRSPIRRKRELAPPRWRTTCPNR
jgi:ribosomal protein S12 methylthiotransferase